MYTPPFSNPRSSKNKVLESGETSFITKTATKNYETSEIPSFSCYYTAFLLQNEVVFGRFLLVFVVKEVSPDFLTLFFEVLGFEKGGVYIFNFFHEVFDHVLQNYRQMKPIRTYIMMLVRKRTFNNPVD